MNGDKRIRWRVVLELQSPLQIGAGNIGMVEKTAIHIPGRVIWGGLVNTIVRAHSGNSLSAQTFVNVGTALGTDGALHFGSFFPSTDSGVTAWQPRYSPATGRRQWVCGETERGEDEMRRWFTISHAATPYWVRKNGQDSTLYATDLVAPKFRFDEQSKPRPLYFVGEIDLPEAIQVGGGQITLDEPLLRTIFSRMRLGGGRKRGWGRILPRQIARVVAEGLLNESAWKDSAGADYRWLLSSDVPVVETGENKAIGRAFLATYRKFDNAAGNRCAGRAYGQAFTHPELHWEIGTLVQV